MTMPDIDLDAIEALTSDPYQYAQVSPEVTRGYLAALVAEVRTLRSVAEAAEDVLMYCVPDPTEEGPCTDLRAALDALNAGGA